MPRRRHVEEPTGEKTLLSTAEVMSYLGITRATLYNHEGRGNIKAYTVYAGKKWYTLKSVRALMKSLRKFHPTLGLMHEKREEVTGEAIADLREAIDLASEGIDLAGKTSKEGQEILRQRLIEYANQQNLLSVIFTSFLSHDWRERHSAVKIILSKVLPDLSATEISDTADDDMKQRQKQALELLQKVLVPERRDGETIVIERSHKDEPIDGGELTQGETIRPSLAAARLGDAREVAAEEQRKMRVKRQELRIKNRLLEAEERDSAIEPQTLENGPQSDLGGEGQGDGEGGDSDRG